MVQHGKSSQEYPVNAGVSYASILGPILFSQYVNDLMILSVISLSMLIYCSVLSLNRHVMYGNN